jgi:hypothetical protein
MKIGATLLKAREAVGWTPEAQAEWLLRFAALRDDQAGLRPGARGSSAWRWEALAFARGGGRHGVMTFDGDPPAWDEVRAAHRDIWSHLLGVLRRGGAEDIELPTMRAELSLEDGRIVSQPTTWESSFPFVDAFRLRAYEALTRLPAHVRFRFCEKTGCGRPFLARRKDKRACSPACSVAVRTTRWREANKPKVNAARKLRYRRAVLGT